MLLAEGNKMIKELERIGCGATSEVFKSLNTESNEIVAYKKIHKNLLIDNNSINRIMREAEILKELNHPNIIKLHSYNHWEEEAAIELEFVEGKNLRDWLDLYGNEYFDVKLSILFEISKGLAFAHEKAVLHRDLKLENILISNKGEVKITDFGLSRIIETASMTKTGMMIGSIAYMAPEMFRNNKGSYAADIYSFAVLAFELLLGRLPFKAENPQSLIHSICTEEIEDFDSSLSFVDPDIRKVLKKCLEKNPEDRPQSILDISSVILTYLQNCNILKEVYDLRSDVENPMYFNNYSSKKMLYIKKQAEDSTSKLSLLSILEQARLLDPSNTELSISIINKIKIYNKEKSKFSLIKIFGFLFSCLIVFIFAVQYFSNTKRKNLNLLTKDNINKLLENSQDTKNDVIAKQQDEVSKPLNLIKKENTINQNVISNAKKEKVKKKLPIRGKVKFILPPDTIVKLLGKNMSELEANKLKLNPGYYQFELIRNGYLPIKSSFQILPNQETIINTIGGE